jgi:predicted DNA-binding transcriptional regulator AlpA
MSGLTLKRRLVLARNKGRQAMTNKLSNISTIALGSHSANHPERLLTSEEVESIMGVGPGWCAKDRISSARIPHIKIGKCVRYRLRDVEAFIDASMRRSTSDTQAVA